MKKVWY